MSIEAISWVLNEAPGLPPHTFGVLMGLANEANAYGCGAFPDQALLAHYARKSVRQVRRDLADLVEAGLIREGDGRYVQHLPADERPAVWDLAMERTRSDSEGTGRTRPVVGVRSKSDEAPGMSEKGPDVGVRSPESEGPDVGVRSNSDRSDEPADLDRTYTTGRVRPVHHGRPAQTSESSDQNRAEADTNADKDRTPTSGRNAQRAYIKGSSSVSSSSSSARATRGTRIPDDFAVTDAMREWGRKTAPGIDGERETERFIDYWRAKAGAGAVKLDWVATWRNWIRTAADRYATDTGGAQGANTLSLRAQQARFAYDKTPHCGQCDPVDRTLLTLDNALQPCPNCHPDRPGANR